MPTDTKPPEAGVHSMSIFNAPRVVLVKDTENGALSIRMGSINITVYGYDPFNVIPDVVEMTEAEFAAERTARLLGIVRGEVDETPPVE